MHAMQAPSVPKKPPVRDASGEVWMIEGVGGGGCELQLQRIWEFAERTWIGAPVALTGRAEVLLQRAKCPNTEKTTINSLPLVTRWRE